MTGTSLGTWAIWVLIVAIAVGTFALRSSFILLFGWIGELSPRLRAALRFIPVAVLAGLTFPAFVYLDGSLVLSGNERLIAGGVATVVAWWTENMLATIGIGMTTLWLLGAVL